MNCQECHHKCNANCCRMFSIPKTDKKIVVLKNKLSDERKYFRLHGCQIIHTNVIIRLEDYRVEIEGDKLLLWRDCNWLDKDALLCKHHELKPFMCGDLNEETKHKYYITKGCRFETK